MRKPFHHLAPLLAMLALSVGTARAQQVSLSEIGPGVLAGARGNIAVNNSAGLGNTQSNQAVIAGSAELAKADARASQQAQRQGAGWQSTGTAQALIGERAFAGAAGIVAVNQASGSGNTQANIAALSAAPFAEASIDALADVQGARPGGGDSGKTRDATVSTRSAVVSDSAFAGARGVVQVNQIAGSGNATVNAFAMSVGASPR